MSNPTVTDKRTPPPYVMIEHSIIDSCLFDCYELALYVALARHVNYHSGDAFPSHKRLCKLLNCSKPRLIKTIDSLEEKGAIKVERKEGEVNHYVLTTFTPPVNDIYTPPVNDVYTKKKKIVNNKPKDSASPLSGGAENSNGSPQSPPIVDTERELDDDYVPNTPHKVLFEFVAEKWHLAKRRKDGIYRADINGELGKVDFAHIQRTVSRVKKAFGDKVKPAEILEYVEHYERECGSNIRLPQGESALMRSVLEWRTQKRRFDPHYDPYADLIPKTEKGKSNETK